MGRKHKRSQSRRQPGQQNENAAEQGYQVWELFMVIESADGEEVAVVDYEITDAPIEQRWFKRLPRPIQQRLHEFHDLAVKEPSRVIEEAQQLLVTYPDVPMLYNVLEIAYKTVDDRQKRQNTVTTCRSKFPEYLFGKIAQAQIYLDHNEPEKIPELFEGHLELRLLYPQRTRFHISEFLGFTGLMALYYRQIGDRVLAKQYYRLLRTVAPRHAVVRQIRRALWVQGNRAI